MGKFKDLTGKKFGRWSVLSVASMAGIDSATGKHVTTKWWCVCDCGTRRAVETASLSLGKSVSCGCHKREMTIARNKSWATHGLSKTSEYGIWKKMVLRCHNETDAAYYRYGARGISVCDRWRDSFENFLHDMGRRPDGMSLDRIDNDLGYTPDNCRWATLVEQANNRSSNVKFTYRGATVGLRELSEMSGISARVLRNRIVNLGYSVELAVSTPVRGRAEIPCDNKYVATADVMRVLDKMLTTYSLRTQVVSLLNDMEGVKISQTV